MVFFFFVFFFLIYTRLRNTTSDFDSALRALVQNKKVKVRDFSVLLCGTRAFTARTMWIRF